MPDELVKKIDKQAKLQGSNRSDFIRLAVRKQMSTLEQWQAIASSARKSYSGPDLDEKQVADIVRGFRKGS